MTNKLDKETIEKLKALKAEKLSNNEIIYKDEYSENKGHTSK